LLVYIMSKVGKKLIAVPAGVEVIIDGSMIRVK
jgi:ribosomal protein L6P/L9E